MLAEVRASTHVSEAWSCGQDELELLHGGEVRLSNNRCMLKLQKREGWLARGLSEGEGRREGCEVGVSGAIRVGILQDLNKVRIPYKLSSSFS
ncbi:unnamed protein product [Dovyalis caffra]|uniref:Uncharacterized protein n=1 Tax=Dovyalis caffra TaxID=77055 RepID=A0AAV1S4C3_9ROSI|nr:unnamed protein product [Dovyalis caffra]